MNKQQLFENIKRKKSFLCVGLDTDIKKIPEHLLKEEDPIFAFNKAIIDATADLCIAYKPNLAFYESMGPYSESMISSESRVPEPIPKTRFNLSHINIVLLQSSITGIICGFPVIKVYHTLYSNKIKITFSVSAGILFHLIS